MSTPLHPGPVQELLDRAGGRIELLVRFSAAKGYELVDWNRAAVDLFEIESPTSAGQSLEWSQLPVPLAEYLSKALQIVSGAPEEALPEYQHPSKPDPNYFAKVFYQLVPAKDGQEEEHWYFFCFQSSVSLLDNSQGDVNQKKLETIGELASGVAHDFNNLIMGIQSNAEAMLAQPEMPQHARDSLVNIIRACSTGASLTRSLLGYAKRQPLTMTPFNLVDLVHDAARIAGVAAGNCNYRIALGKDFLEKSDPIMVVGCYSSLSHCLLNLIKNAREAMPEGGTVHVIWEGTESMAIVTVRDHGAGIPEADLAHIFEPFFSTKKQGTGLGLAMVRGILHQHSGTVEIRSTVGMGTSISLVWPRGDVKAASLKAKNDPDARRSTHRIFRRSQRLIMQSQRMPADAHFLIYVIDDDDLVRDGLCSLLVHLGHRTESYRHPEVALQALLSTDVPPEVVIVDYNMPGMNGAQFIGRYSTAVVDNPKYKNTQILLMSGLPPSHFQDFMSEFAQLKLGILAKPFSLETLRKKLANIQDTRKLSGNLTGLSGVLPKAKVGMVAAAKDS
ncbi:MAG: ATP-binding protein [Methylacidiphilales bacterium]|nr:ATP-binding protein [Candidatus Methylacidiphilales bacterium]